MSAYSFLDVKAAIAGPGIIADMSAGAAIAEEGITIAPVEDKNTMQMGADGRGQHNLIASDACLVTVRTLKSSPLNALLMLAFEFQSTTSLLWGKNTITVSNPANGDLHVVQMAAFKRKPDLTNAKEGGLIEWTFDAIKGNSVLGSGIVANNL